MAIPISFLTAVLKKEALEASYPGGLSRFLQGRPGVPQDEHLVGVSFMSGSELQEFVDALLASGFDVQRGLAVGEMLHGEWEPCHGIEFTAVDPGRPLTRWEARATDTGAGTEGSGLEGPAGKRASSR